MPLKPVRTVIALEPEDVLRLEEILIDADREQSLAYLREVIAPKLRRMQDQSHKPEFEGGITC